MFPSPPGGALLPSLLSDTECRVSRPPTLFLLQFWTLSLTSELMKSPWSHWSLLRSPHHTQVRLSSPRVSSEPFERCRLTTASNLRLYTEETPHDWLLQLINLTLFFLLVKSFSSELSVSSCSSSSGPLPHNSTAGDPEKPGSATAGK